MQKKKNKTKKENDLLITVFIVKSIHTTYNTSNQDISRYASNLNERNHWELSSEQFTRVQVGGVKRRICKVEALFLKPLTLFLKCVISGKMVNPGVQRIGPYILSSL